MDSISIRLHTECYACRTKIPVNGLTAQVACPKCFTEKNIEMYIWKSILSESINRGLTLTQDNPESFTWKEGGLTAIHSYHLTYARILPKDKDGNLIDIKDAVTHSKQGYYINPESNEKISIRRFPEEFSKVFPHRKKIKYQQSKPYEIFIMNEEFSQISKPDSGTVILGESDGIKAVKCTECGSPLEISNDDKNIKCSYCGTYFYIPSGLWQRLHPDKEIIEWYFLVE